MEANDFNSKLELCEAAIELYLQNDYSIHNLSQKTDKSTTEIYSLFPNKLSILKFYYPSLVVRYRAMVEEIDEFETYSISEKLSNFIFTMFDMMDEQRAFVDQTFENWEMKPFDRTKFHKEVQKIIKDMFSSDSKIALSASLMMGDYFYSLLQTEYLYLIRYWLNDDSKDYTRTMALTDKFTGFLEEIAYTKVVDKGFDLFRYAVSSTQVGKKVPGVGTLISRWTEEVNEEENQI